MDALATIPVEIQATLTGILVIVLILALQILDLRGALQRHQLKILELSRASSFGDSESAFGGKTYRLISRFSIFLQFLFGIIVFAVFSCWSLFLAMEGFYASAVLSALTAVAALVMPFIVWLSSRRKNKEVAELIQSLSAKPKVVNEQGSAQVIEIPMPSSAGHVEAKLEAEASTQAESLMIQPTAAKPKALYGSDTWLPEDSMLRRHFLTHIHSCKKVYVPERPTDSMLRRHYESLMATFQPLTKSEPVLTQPRQSEPQAGSTPLAAALKAAPSQQKPKKIPEDSMLRRHYLSMISSLIDAKLSTRPTDSMLSRHFDAWKKALIESELAG